MDGTLILAAPTAADLQSLLARARRVVAFDVDGRRVSYRTEQGLQVIRCSVTEDELARCHAHIGCADQTELGCLERNRALIVYPLNLSTAERDAIAELPV